MSGLHRGTGLVKRMDSRYTDLSGQYAEKLDGYYENERAEMLPFVPEGISSLLEVGCSSAAFGRLVKTARPGCEVWGIEPNADAAARAADNIDVAVCGIFSAGMPELGGRSFDCIVFNDVLEHIADPGSTLADARRHLAPGGAIVASIPNVLHFYNISRILIDQDWKYEKEGIMDNTHLRFFTRKSIIRLFEESGFKVERIEGINPSYGLKYKLVNAATLGRITDWRFIQFATVATAAD